MRFALLDVLTVGGPSPGGREVVPAQPAEPATGRADSEALAIMAAEFRHLREQDHALQRRQAESLESVAEALSRLADGRGEAPAAEPAAHEELEALRQAHARAEAELDAARAELTEAHARADRATRRLAATQDKLRHAREELAAARAPWWRRASRAR